jgi:hypothetical protein
VAYIVEVSFFLRTGLMLDVSIVSFGYVLTYIYPKHVHLPAEPMQSHQNKTLIQTPNPPGQNSPHNPPMPTGTLLLLPLPVPHRLVNKHFTLSLGPSKRKLNPKLLPWNQMLPSTNTPQEISLPRLPESYTARAIPTEDDIICEAGAFALLPFFG